MTTLTSANGKVVQLNDDLKLNDPREFAFVHNPEGLDISVVLASGALYVPKDHGCRFEDLGIDDEDILNALAFMNYRKPSRIQETTLPLLLVNPPVNLIAQSQTGTGKTAAFVLNILMRLDRNLHSTQALVLTPTRELANQIHGVIEKFKRQGFPVTTAVAIPKSEPGSVDCSRSQVVAGTPGTVLNLLNRKVLKNEHIKIFVLDEGDHMLDGQGLKDQSLSVMRFIPKDAQRLMFSATFSPATVEFAKTLAPNANTITLAIDQIALRTVRQIFVDMDNLDDKYQKVVDMYKCYEIASSIIFCATRATADMLQRRLEAEGHKTVSLHSALESCEARDEMVKRFLDGRAKIMITTNVLARGFDHSTVNMVVHYDTPRNMMTGKPDYDSYIHRVGRAGRFGRKGVSVAFVHDQSSWMELEDIMQHFSVPIHVIPPVGIDGLERLIQNIMRDNHEKFPEIGTSIHDSIHAPKNRRR